MLKIVKGDNNSKLRKFPGRQQGRRDQINLVNSTTLKNVTRAIMYFSTSKYPNIGPFYEGSKLNLLHKIYYTFL
jgi:hypothetical protein